MVVWGFYFRYRHWKNCSLTIVKLTLLCSVGGLVGYLWCFGNGLKKFEGVGKGYMLLHIFWLWYKNFHFCGLKEKCFNFWVFGFVPKKKVFPDWYFSWSNKILIETFCKICWGCVWAWQVFVHIFILFGVKRKSMVLLLKTIICQAVFAIAQG